MPKRPSCWIGYSDMQCNDSRGQFYNWRTFNAMIVRADDLSQRRIVAPELSKDENTWTQFAGWSPDGKTAVLGQLWEDPAHYAAERKEQGFLHQSGWRGDICLVDLATGKTEIPSAVERVSSYNSGLFFWPGNPNLLGFTALINGQSHPFSMNRDGTHKKDLTTGAAGFTYGYTASPDGKRIAYHKNYQVFLADADGGNAVHVKTGDVFHFGPLWSPDGKWLTFLAGTHGKCDIVIVGADASNPRKIAGRGGYVGWVELIDTPDFHSASSDIPTWGMDSKWIYYTAQVGQSVELMRVDLSGKIEQLTKTHAGAMHYHPHLSPDGEWVALGSTRDFARALYICRADGSEFTAITQPTPGRAQLHPHWQTT